MNEENKRLACRPRGTGKTLGLAFQVIGKAFLEPNNYHLFEDHCQVPYNRSKDNLLSFIDNLGLQCFEVALGRNPVTGEYGVNVKFDLKSYIALKRDGNLKSMLKPNSNAGDSMKELGIIKDSKTIIRENNNV